MKALILNSGRGTRLGDLTRTTHKSLLTLHDGETILGRQIRLLHDAGIHDFIITVGPHEQQMKNEIHRYAGRYNDASFSIIKNDRYATTNYIYSMWLARELLDDDILLLHGDLVFDCTYAHVLLDCDYPNLGSVDTNAPLPSKDFKAAIIDGKIRQISVRLTSSNAAALQPFYKLSKKGIDIWLDAIGEYVSREQISCYAEDALNEVIGSLDIRFVSYTSHILGEVDTKEDYLYLVKTIADSERCFQSIAFRSPQLERAYSALTNLKKPLVIHGSSVASNKSYNEIIASLDDPVHFSDYSPNPSINDVQKATNAYLSDNRQSILAIGGGSAIDVAKLTIANVLGIFDNPSSMRHTNLPQLISIPTTAGTGSESTQFAAFYREGIKQSFESEAIMPQEAILDPCFISSLPQTYKTASFLDALCQAIESLWSLRSNEISRCFARESLRLLSRYYELYFSDMPTIICMQGIMLGANYAGRAINISKTTAPHAMSYGLTAQFGIPHGYAVALCMVPTLQHLIMLERQTPYHDGRSIGDVLNEIALSLGHDEISSAFDWITGVILDAEIPLPFKSSTTSTQLIERQAEQLTSTVNSDRLSNHPVNLSKHEIEMIYRSILSNQKEYPNERIS